MELDLPDGITFVSATKGNRYEESHSLGMSANGQTVRFTLNSGTNEAIKGNSGALITINVSANADLDAGTKLTATLKGMEFARKDETFIRPDALDFDIEITDRVVMDENSTVIPTATDEEVDILVKRTIKAGQWNTICLPFDMSEEQLYDAFGEDVELAELDTDEGYAVNDDGTIEVYFIDSDLSEGLYGNWPYIIKTSTDIGEFETTALINPDEDGAVAEYYTGKGKNKKLKGTFTGTYHAQTLVPENNLFLSGNQFWYSAGKTKMKAFRAYLWFDDVLSDIDTASSRISMRFSDGSITGIREVNMNRSNDDIFDLQGRRVQQPAKGLYISNGRKALVK